MFNYFSKWNLNRESPTVINYVLSFRCKPNVGLVHGEECPGFAAEVDAMEAGKRQVVAMETDGAPQDGALGGQLEVEHGEFTARHALQHLLPVAVVADLRDPRG